MFVKRQHKNTSLFYESVFTEADTGGNIEHLSCHSASVLVPCRPTAARRGDVFRCPRWVLGSNYVYSDARSCSSPFLQCHSWPLNYSKAPPQVGYFLLSTEIPSRLYQVGNICIHLTCFCALFLLCPPCSDQTDPFNRSPLTMDQIRPNEELKQKILQWLDKHKQERLQLGPSG